MNRFESSKAIIRLRKGPNETSIQPEEEGNRWRTQNNIVFYTTGHNIIHRIQFIWCGVIDPVYIWRSGVSPSSLGGYKEFPFRRHGWVQTNVGVAWQTETEASTICVEGNPDRKGTGWISLHRYCRSIVPWNRVFFEDSNKNKSIRTALVSSLRIPMDASAHLYEAWI